LDLLTILVYQNWYASMGLTWNKLWHRPSQHGSSDMRLWLLGTGTPTPSVRRMCSGYLVEINGDFIVFDHGFGAHHRLLETGISATQVSHAFFSHHHYDHIGEDR